MKVLIIDDNLEFARPVQSLIQMDGSRCEARNSGVEGLLVVGEFKPDLILLDIMMPDMDGPEVLRRLSDAKFRGKVIIFSAISDPQMIQHTKDLGAADYIIKGMIDHAMLRSLVAQYLPSGDTRSEAAATSEPPCQPSPAQ